jgi:hypothetical protein
MSAHAIILLLCALLLVFAGTIVWLLTKLVAARKDLAVEKLAHGDTTETLATTNARLREVEIVGSEMYMELLSRADQAESRSYIVTCLEGKITDLVSHAASMNAKRFAEEKKAVGASILEFLLAVFFPAKCGRTGTV